jgi:hypothetical protein
MPDTLNDTVWTLQDYQDYGREMNLPLYLVCRYKGTKKTVDLKVPDTAKKCSAWFRGNKISFMLLVSSLSASSLYFAQRYPQNGNNAAGFSFSVVFAIP